jgi:hypothetical protein
MPNATVRANARATPKPPPGSPESIRRQTAEHNRDVALLKASQALVPDTCFMERETAKGDAEKHDLFRRAIHAGYVRGQRWMILMQTAPRRQAPRASRLLTKPPDRC